MPALPRRRSPDAREECWHIYYGDVQVGTIAIRIDIPHDEDPWGWDCGFYPASHPGEHRSGTTATTRPAPISKPPGACFYRTGPRLISKHRATHGTGPPGNMPCG